MSIFMKNSNNNNNKTYFRNCQTFFLLKNLILLKKLGYLHLLRACMHNFIVGPL